MCEMLIERLTYWVFGTILGAGDIILSKLCPCLYRFYLVMEETGNKHTSKFINDQISGRSKINDLNKSKAGEMVGGEVGEQGAGLGCMSREGLSLKQCLMV